MRRLDTLRNAAIGLSAVMAAPLIALAQTPSIEERLTKAEAAAASAQSAGDNAWMLTSAALVLMMTGPGLALFYGGLVRKKNVLATMMQSFILMAIITVLWAIYGYSTPSQSNPVFGGLSYIFLKGVGAAPNGDYAATIPQQTFMVFQLMFAIITPALITGAFAERMKFSAMVAFMILWATIVYFPLAHMVWGKGGFLNAFLGGKVPALDFAGGTVVHISSGFSARLCSISASVSAITNADATPVSSSALLGPAFSGRLVWINAGSAVAQADSQRALLLPHFAAAAAALGITCGVDRQGFLLCLEQSRVRSLALWHHSIGFVTPNVGLIID
jgi:Amt family ammonium transporter